MRIVALLGLAYLSFGSAQAGELKFCAPLDVTDVAIYKVRMNVVVRDPRSGEQRRLADGMLMAFPGNTRTLDARSPFASAAPGGGAATIPEGVAIMYYFGWWEKRQVDFGVMILITQPQGEKPPSVQQITLTGRKSIGVRTPIRLRGMSAEGLEYLVDVMIEEIEIPQGCWPLT